MRLTVKRYSSCLIAIRLWDKDHDGYLYCIGNVKCLRRNDGTWETHSHLDEGYRYQGLGVRMYAKAIDCLLRKRQQIGSSIDPSSDARHAWRSKRLRSLFDISKKGCRFVVNGRKKRYVQI